MKRVTAPVNPNDRGEVVQNLQDALLFLIEKELIKLPPNFLGANPPAEVAALRLERDAGAFGNGTMTGVRLFRAQFQEQFGLTPGEVVDDPTAKALNRLLEGQGVLDAPAPPAEPAGARVFGMVRNGFGEPLDGVLVQAFDRDLRSEQLLGSTTTQAGNYEIRYTQDQFRNAEKGQADLVVKVLRVTGEELHKTAIRYNVPAEAEVNINLQGVDYKGPSEWETLTATLTPLLEDVAPLDLREDDQFQDVSFLAGETGTSRETIAAWVVCFRLADKTAREQAALLPEVFFGFLRQGQPALVADSLLQDLQVADHLALTEDKILRALARIAPDQQQALLTKALADALIPARVGADLPGILETLGRLRLRYAADGTFGGGKGTIGQLLALTPAAKQQEAAFMTAFTAHSGPIGGFWKTLATSNVLAPEVVQQVKLSFELGALARNHVPLVAELARQFQSGALKAKRDLARLDGPAWKRLFQQPGPDGQPIGVPANIDGDSDEARQEQFAVILGRQFERAYPTTSFAAKLARAAQSPVPAKTDVVRFLDNNADFQLDRGRIDHYLAGHDEALKGIENKEALLTDLKSIQRIFKLNPTHKVVDALLTRRIDSAQQIYFMGQDQFVKAVADTDINKLEAKKLYRKSENAYALALALFGDYNHAMNQTAPGAVPAPVPDPATQAKIAALPNLQTLFGSLDFCECTDCRSVYSPAAYFVDIMRFLGERGTQGSGPNAGKQVQQVLLERRPDLGEVELSCENTNTPLPYIDLVNELLEDVVAPPQPVALTPAIAAELVAGPASASLLAELAARQVAIGPDALVYAPDSRGHWAVRDAQHAYKVVKSGADLLLTPTHQTFLSAAELRANPAYTNVATYGTVLNQAVFPLALPFDLFYQQARAYLAHLGVPQPRLLELFQQKLPDDATLAPGNLQIACAWLGITETERQILTGELPARQPWEFWGLAETGNNVPNPATPTDPTTNATGPWLGVLSNVEVLLHRAGLSYQELLQLLDLSAVNPDGTVFIFDGADPNAASCDTSTFVLRNLTADALTRLHRFVRLWRKLGCTLWELDLLLPVASPAPAPVDKPITKAVLQDLASLNRLREQTGLEWRILHSLYHGIDHAPYVDRTQAGAPAVPTLYQRLFRNKLVDAVASFPASPDQLAGPIAAQVPGLLAAFRIQETDLSLILADLGLAPADALDASVLGQIYRVTVLAQLLSLPIDSLLRLKRLSAQDPFSGPAATWDFVELAQQVAASRFSVLELDYLLAHRFTAGAGVALEDKLIATVLQTLREGLRKIGDDLRRKAEETPAAYVKSKLGLLPALAKDADQVAALAIIDGTWPGPPAQQALLIDAFFGSVLAPAVAETKLAPLAAGLSPAARQAAVDQRFAFVQPALETFLVQTQQESFIRQQLAEVLQLDGPSASALLTGLHLPGAAGPLLPTINDPRLLDLRPDGTYQLAPDEASFPAIFRALRLLHKDALMVGKLQIKAAELAWWLAGTHAADLGWMHPADFPVDPTTSVDIKQWVAIERFFGWQSDLPKSGRTAVEFATNVLDPAQTSAQNIADLAQLMAWNVADITTLATAFHWLDPGAGFDVVKQQLRNAASLRRLADCLRALRRLGVNAARAVGWARAEPTSADADSLKQTVKAKYDLAQWQQVIQPLQDEFRELKRQALVSWLVAHPNQAAGQNWLDANGLYSYFLIDVEMSACMLTSRLKQAAASVQLFVQRCLLNLEVDILAKTDLDDKWKQWPWMKRYRVWEANRKVFLYPENWIEPELRDEKSPFFKELESELMQNDITTDTAGQAYLNYLEKLDKVANLEIRALYHEVISAGESALHVVGRSRSSQGPEYYYRRRVNGARWLAWEKVETEINANHLMVGVLNRRLYLLWPQFLPKADAPKEVHIPSADTTKTYTLELPVNYWEVRLSWSERKKGKWTPKTLSDTLIRLDQAKTGGDNTANVEFLATFGLYVPVMLLPSNDPAGHAPLSIDRFFGKVGRQVNQYPDSGSSFLLAPTGGRYANNLLRHAGSSYYFGNFASGGGKITANVQAQAPATSSEVLRNIKSDETYSVVDLRGGTALSNGSFFVWDTDRVYFVDYTWQENQLYTSRGRKTQVNSSFSFFIHYHPFVELFIKELNIGGLKGLLNRRIQVAPASIPGSPALWDFAGYQPTAKVAKNYQLPDKTFAYPIEDVDFTYLGAYAPYNWELFFHVPFFIANKLSTNQRFEEALAWYHYIFDPTNTDNATATPDTPQQKFWITKPFYQTTKADYYQQKIEHILLAVAKGDAAVRAQVSEWRANPFNPHLIARMRTVAYQKNLLIKYIQTLIAWGDQLFGQDTIESINEATQLYVLAASVLGPRPKSIPKKVPNPVKTFYQLQQDGIDDFGNVLKEVENLLPAASSDSLQGEAAPELPRLDVLYFCIPNNEKLLTLWDTVDDRLFKIRHCLNLAGVVRQLPLFEPPIDPALLVKAVAAGLDIGAALNDLNAPLPLYRFSFTVQRALEICTEVKALGAAMLSALEKRDNEAFALLRSSHEQIMLTQIRLVKSSQIDEALRTKEALEESKKVAEERLSYYSQLVGKGLNDWETASLALTGGAIVAEVVSTVLNALGSGTSMIPEVTGGASGFGGSPTLTLSLGGKSVTSALSKAADVSRGVASILQISAGMTATLASHNRRAEEWRFQQRLAEKELPQIDKQILAADIRHNMATQELTNQDKQVENAQKEAEFLHAKFTNQELYDWMLGQLSAVYFQSYQLAYDVAKRAERCFRYELGLTDSSYVQFGYWDSLKKGLLSGEKLYYDLKRLESAYYEQNRREYELSKHVSLAQLDPIALLKLRQNGECFVDVPETAFDQDYPGHYFRRLKSVGLSIPCVLGPYTTVACTLTLTSNHLRKDPTLLAGKYARDPAAEDPRFRDELAAIQSIATSSAQNDSGLFELSFRDERYLPFEGAGAISSWHLKLNQDFPQFDFSTIADVILHLHYTAREAGELLRAKAVEEFNKKLNELALSENRRGLYRVFDLKREYSDRWYQFLHPANAADDQALVLDDLPDRLPFFTRRFATKKARQLEVVAQTRAGTTYRVQLSPLGTTPAAQLPLAPDPTYQGLHRAFKDLTGSEVPLGAWTLKIQADGAADFRSLPADAIQELFLIVNYTIA